MLDLVEDARAAKSCANRFAAAGHAGAPGRELLQWWEITLYAAPSARKGNLPVWQASAGSVVCLEPACELQLVYKREFFTLVSTPSSKPSMADTVHVAIKWK